MGTSVEEYDEWGDEFHDAMLMLMMYCIVVKSNVIFFSVQSGKFKYIQQYCRRAHWRSLQSLLWSYQYFSDRGKSWVSLFLDCPSNWYCIIWSLSTSSSAYCSHWPRINITDCVAFLTGLLFRVIVPLFLSDDNYILLLNLACYNLPLAFELILRRNQFPSVLDEWNGLHRLKSLTLAGHQYSSLPYSQKHIYYAMTCSLMFVLDKVGKFGWAAS